MSENQCKHLDRWFDRSICPEPCGSMHDVCVDCGVIVGGCPLPALYAKEQSARQEAAGEAVARWLETQVGTPSQFSRAGADEILALPEMAALIGNAP